jgi:malate dehydrogenase (oxaloacetate-decarboxylating)
LEEQVKRKYRQYEEQGNDLQKNIYLTTLHYRNEVLFYEVLSEHLQEMLLIIYDPTIGIAIEESLAIRDILSIMIDQLYMLVVFYSF